MIRFHRLARGYAMSLSALPLIALTGCATIGSVMSPYSEKFSCKNSDHGQCIHPERAWADAVAGRPSKSDPAVTNDRKLLTPDPKAESAAPDMDPDMDKAVREMTKLRGKAGVMAEIAAATNPPKLPYADIATLSAGTGTPMLRPSRTLRTLILPYADRQRPDRLYMARYVYSIVERPAWVVGDYLVEPAGHKAAAPVLHSTRDSDTSPNGAPAEDAAPSPLSPEPRP